MPGSRGEFGSTNREKSFKTKEIRVRFRKGEQVGETVGTPVFEPSECDESIHVRERLATWPGLGWLNIASAGWEVHHTVSLRRSLWSPRRDTWSLESSDLIL